MAPRHGWLVARDGNNAFELINHARTAAYLANPDITIDGVNVCSVLDFGGCENYASLPVCYQDAGGWAEYPGVIANWLSTPDAPALDIVGDITVVARVAAADWSPAASTLIAAKTATAGQFSWFFYLDSLSRLTIYTSTDGTALVPRTSVVLSGPPAAGSWLWVAFTLDVNNGAGGNTTRFWTSTNGVNWTLLGSPITYAGVTSIFSGTDALEIGAYISGNNVWEGQYQHFSVRNGIGAGGAVGGTEVFRISRETFLGVSANAASFTADTGQTVTAHHYGGTPLTIASFVPAHESWEIQSFDTPETDDAPWWNPDYPESADALGFVVEEWTGLDDRHVVRTMTRSGRARGGASANSIGNRERVMKLNILLLANSEDAMMYLFRWFAATLESVCSQCQTNAMLIRDYCGSIDEVTKGVVELRDVALIEGLGWEADPVRDGQCFIRRASFTIAAGDPCMYLPSTAPEVTAGSNTLGASLLTTNYSLDRYPPRPSCSELPSGARQVYTWDAESAMGAKAPVIDFYNNDPEHAFPFRALVYYDPYEIGATPNPCGLQILGEVYVKPMPPYSHLRWDVAGREIEYRDPTTGTWVEGWFLLDANDGPQRYFVLPCDGQYHLALEPGTLAIERVGVVGNVFEWGGIIFSDPHYPDVDVTVQERVSCS